MFRALPLVLAAFAATAAFANEAGVQHPAVDPNVRAEAHALQPRMRRDTFPIAMEAARVERFTPRRDGGEWVIGEVRSLPSPLRLEPRQRRVGESGIRIRVPGAEALRLHLESKGAVLWIGGSDDAELTRFEATPSSTWGPTTNGDAVDIIVERGSSEVIVREFANIAVDHGVECVIASDATCFDEDDLPGIDRVRRAIAMINFVRGTVASQCSGGLINDRNGTGTAYFLTANHCIPNAATAATIEATWDYRSTVCGGTATAGAKTFGAQMLVTSTASDVTLLLLAAIPPDRVFLGWDVRPGAVVHGTALHRLSNPLGRGQSYASTTANMTGVACPTRPRPNYIYGDPVYAATAGGSSGSPLLLAGGYVVGQLQGQCTLDGGGSPFNPCDRRNDTTDGALAASWPLLQPYLDCQPGQMPGYSLGGCIMRRDCAGNLAGYVCP